MSAYREDPELGRITPTAVGRALKVTLQSVDHALMELALDPDGNDEMDDALNGFRTTLIRWLRPQAVEERRDG